jgi:hypothetical protein
MRIVMPAIVHESAHRGKALIDDPTMDYTGDPPIAGTSKENHRKPIRFALTTVGARVY